MNPIVKEKMAEYFRDDPQGAKRSFEIMAWRALALVMSIVGGLVVRYGESKIRELTADRIAMQRGLVAEADYSNGLLADHDAVRRHATWSSYPARIILEWCQTCQKAQDADSHSYPQCGRCDANKDGTLSGEDIEIITQYVRARFDGFRAAIDTRGNTVDELLSMGQTITEHWWDELEATLGE